MEDKATGKRGGGIGEGLLVTIKYIQIKHYAETQILTRPDILEKKRDWFQNHSAICMSIYTESGTFFQLQEKSV